MQKLVILTDHPLSDEQQVNLSNLLKEEEFSEITFSTIKNLDVFQSVEQIDQSLNEFRSDILPMLNSMSVDNKLIKEIFVDFNSFYSCELLGVYDEKRVYEFVKLKLEQNVSLENLTKATVELVRLLKSICEGCVDFAKIFTPPPIPINGIVCTECLRTSEEGCMCVFIQKTLKETFSKKVIINESSEYIAAIAEINAFTFPKFRVLDQYIMEDLDFKKKDISDGFVPLTKDLLKDLINAFESNTNFVKMYPLDNEIHQLVGLEAIASTKNSERFIVLTYNGITHHFMTEIEEEKPKKVVPKKLSKPKKEQTRESQKYAFMLEFFKKVKAEWERFDNA